MAIARLSQYIICTKNKVTLNVQSLWENINLQILTGIPPLDRQLEYEAELSQVTRFGISTNSILGNFYIQKVSKCVLHSSWKRIRLLDLSNFMEDSKILRDCSNANDGIGSTFCCFNETELIFFWKSRLESENSVFQA